MIAEAVGITIATGCDARDEQLSIHFHERRSTGITRRRITLAVAVEIPFNVRLSHIVNWCLPHSLVAKISIRATCAGTCFTETNEC